MSSEARQSSSRRRLGVTRLASDDRLVRRAAGDDRRALEEIYRRYRQDLYRFCLAMLGNPQDAQDAVQNTMVKVLRALPGEQRRIELKPWLYRIARNESVELVRKRQDVAEGEAEDLQSTVEIASTVETRERLRLLIADLRELPERQRAALVMRELGGLAFAQIAAAFDSSEGVARQTIYEARLSLRQMEGGREMSCDAVKRELSDADGRVARRREIRAHLRGCEDCRAFREGIAKRHHDLASIAPLPALAAASLPGILAGTASGAVGGAVAKSAATLAVVAVVGVSAADRSGLVDVPLPTDRSADSEAVAPPPHPVGEEGSLPKGPAAIGLGGPGTERAADRGSSRSDAGAKQRGDAESVESQSEGRRSRGNSTSRKATRGSKGGGHSQGKSGKRGKPAGLPPASGRGQTTAGGHKSPRSKGSPGVSESRPEGGSGGGTATAPTGSSRPTGTAGSGTATEPKSTPPIQPKAAPPVKGGAAQDPVTVPAVPEIP